MVVPRFFDRLTPSILGRNWLEERLKANEEARDVALLGYSSIFCICLQSRKHYPHWLSKILLQFNCESRKIFHGQYCQTAGERILRGPDPQSIRGKTGIASHFELSCSS